MAKIVNIGKEKYPAKNINEKEKSYNEEIEQKAESIVQEKPKTIELVEKEDVSILFY